MSPTMLPLPAFAEGGNGGSVTDYSGGGAGGADSATATGGAGGNGGFVNSAGGGGGAGVAGGAGGNGGGDPGAGGAGASAVGGAGTDGGQGGDGRNNGGGGGGGGAHGAVLTTTTTDAGATGGGGGNGGNGTPVFTNVAGGGGGGGGAAGWGVVVDGTGLTYTLTGTAAGGTGGAGGNGTGTAGNGGAGGTGGTGVTFTGSGTLVNSGSILGGTGGAGGTSAYRAGAAGAGGSGVVGADLTIVNAGAISGGLAGDGVTRANAISFTGGSNSLTLQEGWSLTGDLGVNAAGSSLTFKLDGIDADVSNNITGQGGVIVDVGPQVLTLSGVNSYSGGTTITSGTLSVASAEALGDGVSLTFDAPVSGVTGLSDAASTLSSAISAYASAPTAENAAALAAAQAGYRQTIDEGQSSGELPTLQVTGVLSLNPGTDRPIAIGDGQAGTIRLEGDDAALTMFGFPISGTDSAIKVGSGGVLDLGVGEGQVLGYVFAENHADTGGALYNASGTVSIAHANFTGNSAATSSGAILNTGVMTLSDSAFSENSADYGGAIGQFGTLLVERSTFTDNDVQSVGGAIYISGGSPTTVIASSFSGNSAGEQGGAISAEGAYIPVVLSVVDSDFTGNSAGSVGGAIALQGGTLNLTVSAGSGSLFSGNTAGGQASAIHVGTGVRMNVSPSYFVYTASTLNVDTGTGALLDMRDPMSGYADNVTNTVAKTGAGTWALGGGSVLAVSGTGATDFSVSEGQLYLYAAGEVDNPTTDDEDAVVGAGTIQLDGATSTFTVGADGTLVAGGANSVTTAGIITFEDGATLRGGNADTAMGGTDPTFMEKGGATSLSLTATGGITLEGTLNVAALGATDSFTLDGALGGEHGALTKTGAGTVVLTGANTYAGGTRIEAGTLSVSSNANLGAAAGGLAFDGGTLATTASFDSARAITLLASSSIDVAASTTLGLSGAVTGTGTLTKQGGGILALSGVSSVDWSVEAGRLSADAADFSGAVALAAGAQLDLTASSASTYAGTLSGAGTFVKDGAALLTYSGNGAAFTGLTEVAEGRLAVDGVLGGRVDVLSGGILGGTGTVGALDAASGGRVGPGNSAGTLTVTGDASFGAGSVYEVEIHGTGVSDLLAVQGTAYLNGGLVELTALDPEGSYRTGQIYTILTAQDGVIGSFDGLEVLSPFLRAKLGQSSNAVDVTIAVEHDFTTVAVTPNQYATAAALDTLGHRGASLELYNALLFLPTGSQARGAFDQLSGEVHASAQSVFMEQSGLIRGALNDRLRAAQAGVGAAAGSVVSGVETADGALAYAVPSKVQMAAEMSLPLKAAPAPLPAERFALWTTGFGNWGAFDSTANATGITDSTGGFLIGADTLVGDVWRVGIGGGYSSTSFSAAGRASSGNSDNWHAALYAGGNWDALAVRTGLAYTWQDVATSRSVAFPGFADRLSADYSAGTLQAFGELGYRIDTAFAAFEPFANLAYVSLDTSGYTETGGAAALQSNGVDMNTGFATLGVRVAKELTSGVHATTLRGAIGWRQAFGDITPAMSEAFQTSSVFTVTGTPIAETAAVLEAGLDMRLGTGATLGIAYTGQFGDGVEQNGFNATLKASF
ncbi:autotransporter domain-containing protein [Starkeya koreensis]|uniref:Autotransporter domain-containing protein n=1 Tax=Ancylobacter koreensis TaxID=266121 RepID=A0ABT0DH97_9HYPH|nr:autotransporter domain-containing protein [Ancylobacter koreensis]